MKEAPNYTEPRSFQLEGEIDIAAERDLSAALADAIRAGIRVIDASGVTFIDSTGIHLLLRASADLNGSGPLVILRPSRQMRRVVDLMLPQGAPGIEFRDA